MRACVPAAQARGPRGPLWPGVGDVGGAWLLLDAQPRPTHGGTARPWQGCCGTRWESACGVPGLPARGSLPGDTEEGDKDRGRDSPPRPAAQSTHRQPRRAPAPP